MGKRMGHTPGDADKIQWLQAADAPACIVIINDHLLPLVLTMKESGFRGAALVFTKPRSVTPLVDRYGSFCLFHDVI